MATVLYQALAEPVNVEAAAPETVTLDKWNPYPPSAPKRPLVRPTGGETSPTGTDPDLRSFEMVWYQPASEPVRKTRPRPPAPTVEVTDAPLIRPFEMSWWQQASEPVRKTPRAQHGYATFLPNDPLIRAFELDWWRQPSEPVRKTAKALQGFATFLPDDALLRPFGISFAPQSPLAPKRSKLWPLGSVAFGGNPANFVEPGVILLDYWWQPTSRTPIRSRPRPPGQGGGLLPPRTDGEVITLDKWFVPASEPVRKTPKARYGIFVFGGHPGNFVEPENVFLAHWFVPASMLPPKRGRPQYGYATFFPADPLIRAYELDWWRQPSEPIRRTRSPLRSFGQGGGLLPPRTDGEVITLDKWLSLQPAKLRLRAPWTWAVYLTDSGIVRVDVSNIVRQAMYDYRRRRV